MCENGFKHTNAMTQCECVCFCPKLVWKDTFQSKDQLMGHTLSNWGQKMCPPIDRKLIFESVVQVRVKARVRQVGLMVRVIQEMNGSLRNVTKSIT